MFFCRNVIVWKSRQRRKTSDNDCIFRFKTQPIKNDHRGTSKLYTVYFYKRSYKNCIVKLLNIHCSGVNWNTCFEAICLEKKSSIDDYKTIVKFTLKSFLVKIPSFFYLKDWTDGNCHHSYKLLCWDDILNILVVYPNITSFVMKWKKRGDILIRWQSWFKTATIQYTFKKS